MDEHRAMRNLSPQMIIGTPGRVLDHMQKENFDYTHIDTLVIDEFDKSLELGFRQQMADILALLPSVRKRILLSATDSPEIPSFVGAVRLFNYTACPACSSLLAQGFSPFPKMFDMKSSVTTAACFCMSLVT